MIVSSPSGLRLPHASAGPFWLAPSVEPAHERLDTHEWHEIEVLLSGPALEARSSSSSGRSLRSFTIVAGALVFGGGILVATLMNIRTDCGALCRAATTEIAAPAKPTPAIVQTAGLSPASNAGVVEGRSAAEPSTGAAMAPAAADPTALPLPHKRHRRHRH